MLWGSFGFHPKNLEKGPQSLPTSNTSENKCLPPALNMIYICSVFLIFSKIKIRSQRKRLLSQSPRMFLWLLLAPVLVQPVLTRHQVNYMALCLHMRLPKGQP